MKQQRFNELVVRTVGSKAALLRAMQRNNTPVNERTFYNWMRDVRVIQLSQLINMSKAMDVPVCELINSINMKHEGDE